MRQQINDYKDEISIYFGWSLSIYTTETTVIIYTNMYKGCKTPIKSSALKKIT